MEVVIANVPSRLWAPDGTENVRMLDVVRARLGLEAEGRLSTYAEDLERAAGGVCRLGRAATLCALGPAGSNSDKVVEDLVATARGQGLPGLGIELVDDMDNVFAVLEGSTAGECVGLLPVANTIGGWVGGGTVLDAILEHGLEVHDVIGLRLAYSLFARLGADVRDLRRRRVESHPEALRQCASCVQDYELVNAPTKSTAAAARRLSDDTCDRGALVIVSPETGKRYGLVPVLTDVGDLLPEDLITVMALVTKPQPARI